LQGRDLLDFLWGNADNYNMGETMENSVPEFDRDTAQTSGNQSSDASKLVNIGLWTLDRPVAYFELKMFTDFFKRIQQEDKTKSEGGETTK
jgi:hypothetical protein